MNTAQAFAAILREEHVPRHYETGAGIAVTGGTVHGGTKSGGYASECTGFALFGERKGSTLRVKPAAWNNAGIIGGYV
ncbi:MAG: hypothetical protein WCC90_14860 [Methylocella sp.]